MTRNPEVPCSPRRTAAKHSPVAHGAAKRNTIRRNPTPHTDSDHAGSNRSGPSRSASRLSGHHNLGPTPPNHPDQPRTYADRAFARFRCSRNPADLETVVRETSRPLLTAARSMTRDDGNAEELVQSTYVAAIDGAHAYDPDHPVVPWLLGILSNRAMRARRICARSLDPTRVRRECPAPDPSDTVYQREFVDLVTQSIATLPTNYAAVLDLHLRLGLSPVEIARRLRRPRSTVRTQIARGLAKLRDALRECPAIASSG